MSDQDQKDIDATKAPLMEHLIELRRRLIWSLGAIAIAFAVCFYFSRPLYNLLLWPYRLAAGVDTPIEMIYTAPQEFFFTEMKLALFGAIFIAFPVIASQIYMFVAPGLYRSERKAFLPFLAATPILQWSWKLLQLPERADLRRWETSDAAPHLFAIWPRRPEIIRSRLIGYVWDPALPVGTVQKSQKTGTVTFMVVRSTTTQLGQWLTERRNIAEDFRSIYGEDAESPAAIALSVDTNDTRSKSEGLVGEIVFRRND